MSSASGQLASLSCEDLVRKILILILTSHFLLGEARAHHVDGLLHG